ncbi:MAG: HpsJ family protein [Cyanobacteria bacterium P01_A01_bin.116]
MKSPPSIGIPRIIGYSLLLMIAMDWFDTLFPPRFLNSTWELETVGALVEGVPLLMFAAFLIFYGEGVYRNRLEQILVRILSQACLLVAICFFLLIPVAANSTIRINQEIDQQVGDGFAQQMAQIDQLEEQLEQASNTEIVAILESQGLQEIEDAPSVAPKEQLLEYLTATRKEIRQETSTIKSRRKRSTLKSAFKWAVGAIISSFTFGYIWKLTQWARVVKPKKLRP